MLSLWKGFRNLAYGLLAVVMIVVGFMVMLRKKIDPKTVVTVQNALPRIVITLILITFSYAIVGILIDLMYVLVYLVVSTIGNASGLSLTDITKLQNAYVTEGGSKILGTLFSAGFGAVPEMLGFVFGSPAAAGVTVGGITAGTAGTAILIFSALGSSVANPLTWIPLALTLGVGILGALILAIVLLFAYIRIFFMLLNSYINIVIALLFAPLQILMDAVPGNTSFSQWFTNLVANLLVFPATIGLLMIGSVLSFKDTEQLWAPPLLSEGSQGTYGLSGILSLGILLSIPTIIKGLKEAMKAKPLFAATSGLGQAVSSPMATGMQALSTMFYVKQLGGNALIDKIAGKKKDDGAHH
jgi:hypothetical protein